MVYLLLLGLLILGNPIIVGPIIMGGAHYIGGQPNYKVKFYKVR